MTNDTKKPREFWIYNKPDFWKVADNEDTAKEYPAAHPIIHVIEKSAYDKMRKEYEEIQCQIEEEKEELQTKLDEAKKPFTNTAWPYEKEWLAQCEKLASALELLKMCGPEDGNWEIADRVLNEYEDWRNK